MSRRVCNSARLCFSHPFSRVKRIDQWAVDPHPVLTSNTSAEIGKTAIASLSSILICFCRILSRPQPDRRHSCARLAPRGFRFAWVLAPGSRDAPRGVFDVWLEDGGHRRGETTSSTHTWRVVPLEYCVFCTRYVRLLKCTCSDVNRKMFRHGPYPLAGSTMKHSTGM